MSDRTRAAKQVIPFGDAVRAAIESGDILLSEGIVKVGNVDVPYDKLTAVTLAGATALAGGQTDQVRDTNEDGSPKTDEDGSPVFKRGTTVAGDFTYGFDLGRRAKVRQQYEAAAEGPQKQIDRAVADLVKLGFSEDDAKRIVASRPGA